MFIGQGPKLVGAPFGAESKTQCGEDIVLLWSTDLGMNRAINMSLLRSGFQRSENLQPLFVQSRVAPPRFGRGTVVTPSYFVQSQGPGSDASNGKSSVMVGKPSRGSSQSAKRWR